MTAADTRTRIAIERFRAGLRGLTLWQPMAWAIVAAGKDIENRPWAPWKGVTHIAIHAGQRWSNEHASMMEKLGVKLPDSDDEVHQGAVLGIAKIRGSVSSRSAAAAAGCVCDAQWWAGPVGWLLSDAVCFDKPIQWRAGRQGLWRLQDGLDDIVIDRAMNTPGGPRAIGIPEGRTA